MCSAFKWLLAARRWECTGHRNRARTGWAGVLEKHTKKGSGNYGVCLLLCVRGCS